jgi:hypothetical protein
MPSRHKRNVEDKYAIASFAQLYDVILTTLRTSMYAIASY